MINKVKKKNLASGNHLLGPPAAAGCSDENIFTLAHTILLQ